MKKLSMIAVGSGIAILGSVNSAEALSYGGKLYSTGGNATVQVLRNDSGYLNELRLFSSLGGSYTSIAYNTQVGTTVDLGSFTAGTELLFGIFVHNTWNTFYMGEAGRNPDNVVHNVVNEIASGNINVGFEDILRGGDQDYNDVIFNFRGAIAPTPPPVTAVPFDFNPTEGAALGIPLFIGLGMLRKKKLAQKLAAKKVAELVS